MKQTKSLRVRIIEGILAIIFGVLAYELIVPSISLLAAYAVTLVGQTQQEALSAPTGLVAAILAAFVSGWLAKGALRENKPPKIEDSAINSG
jgi:hypothetical protein